MGHLARKGISFVYPLGKPRRTSFNGAETNFRIASNLGILLMNSNCFAIYFQQHFSYVCSDIYYTV